MRIALGTIELTDDDRRAINRYYGLSGLATRERCRGFVISNGIEEIDNQQHADDRDDDEDGAA